ncbi:MAG TPA: CNP1-like family protein, partial [Burkholderiales bacterium]|nr:CNP1-like family protein [Burkholderiales bacterium]
MCSLCNPCWRKSVVTIAVAGMLLLTLPAMAQWKDWDYELDQEKKPWEELQAKLPSYPKPENLLKFDIGSNTANSYFVDAASVSVGEDGVVRYTLVIKTGGGATNVSFEGI